MITWRRWFSTAMDGVPTLKLGGGQLAGDVHDHRDDAALGDVEPHALPGRRRCGRHRVLRGDGADVVARVGAGRHLHRVARRVVCCPGWRVILGCASVIQRPAPYSPLPVGPSWSALVASPYTTPLRLEVNPSTGTRLKVPAVSPSSPTRMLSVACRRRRQRVLDVSVREVGHGTDGGRARRRWPRPPARHTSTIPAQATPAAASRRHVTMVMRGTVDRISACATRVPLRDGGAAVSRP